jgi:hypothetical protein
MGELENELIEPLVAEMITEPEVVATRIFSSLELADKLGSHLKTVHRAIEALDKLRHIPSDDKQWPDTKLPDDVPLVLKEHLYCKLAEVTIQLGHDPHDSNQPDLFGEAYRRRLDAAFHAILEERDDLARLLVPIVITTADRARERLIHDLARNQPREQMIFGTEPLVDMMELSGYALLMSEITGKGIWLDVRDLWDRILSSDTAPSLAQQLTAALLTHENILAVASGHIGRINRQKALSNLLVQRGIVHEDHGWGEPVPSEHNNPIVAAFACNNQPALQHDLADLFVVEYLALRTDMANLTISRSAETLQESLQNRRLHADDEE